MAQSKGKKRSTVAICTELAEPVALRLGIYLWDVLFEKEGAGWYLRYFIDKDPDGVDLIECEEFSRTMSDILDEEDPIEQGYCLEVGSPGIERRLTKDWHFQKYLGERVEVKLIRPVEGVREFLGTLGGYDAAADTVTIALEGDVEMTFTLAETAYVKLYAEV